MGNAKQSRPHPGPLGSLAIALAGASALWLVFVAGAPAQECLLGAVCALACTAFMAYMWRAQADHFAWNVRDVLEIRHVPGQIVHDAFLVIGILSRDLFGIRAAESLYMVHAFDASSSQPPDARKLARETLAVAYMTASPNSIVLGIHQHRKLMLVHQLAETPLSEMARELGAGEASTSC